MTWLLAASDSKDLPSLLHPLLRADDAVLAVEFESVDGMPWVKAMRAGKVLDAARGVLREKRKGRGEEVLVGEEFGGDVVGALRRACEIAGEGPLVVAGSLYLVGSVLRALRRGEEGEGAERG